MEKLQEELEKLKEKFDTLCDILKCPVCWEIVNKDSVLCFNGHSVCRKCRDKLTVCPTCRGNFSNVKKNAIASQVLEVISQKCKYENCSEMVKPGEDHEKYCCYRPISCANGNCSWIGPVNELIDHFGSGHNTCILEEKNPSVVLPKIDINEQFRSCIMYSVHGHYLWEKGLNDVKTGLLTFTYIPVLKSNLRPDILVKNCFKGREMSFTITKRVTLNENNQTVRNTLSIPTSMLNGVWEKDQNDLFRSVYISVAND